MNLIKSDRLWAFLPLIFRSAEDECTCIWKTSNSSDQQFRSDLKCVFRDALLNTELIDTQHKASGSKKANMQGEQLRLDSPVAIIFVTISCRSLLQWAGLCKPGSG